MIGPLQRETGVLRQFAAALRPRQRGKMLWRAKRDASAFRQVQQADDLHAARRQQPVETFDARVGARHASAQRGAIIEARGQRRRPLDERAVQPGGERAIIDGLVDQPLGDQHFVGADALRARPLRREVQKLRRDAGLDEKGDFRRRRSGCKGPGAAI
jgi:hypothetical protein